MEALSQLFYLHGIGYEYTKYTGEHVFFSEDTRKRALQCCEIDTEDEASIAQLNYQLDAATWLQFVPEVSLVERATKTLAVRIDSRQLHLQCQIDIESLDLHVAFPSLESFNITGEYYLYGVRYIEVAIPLPLLPVGYHQADVCVGSQRVETQIWSVPQQVHQVSDDKRTGLSIQLYTLKNKARLGIGDFSDLLGLTSLCAKQGMDYILLNPLHLLFADAPERASPYSPNSRALINPLYIAVELSADSHNNAQLDTLMASDAVTTLQQNPSSFIDYQQVTGVKYQLFEALFQQFQHSATPQRRLAFEQFCETHATTLNTLNSVNPTFDYYLQWQAHLQLADCQQSCIDQGMEIGLINDLAVGCAADGIEFNNQASLFSRGATVGAPPDPWAENGQDWGLPALNPQRLSQQHYQFYRALIRANMRHVGGLRIDHVMALRRLWWCFKNNGEQQGCYVYYPFSHLLAILKIESHLNQCIVIGEDLGIVPQEVKTALADGGIFSNSLFYFEKDSDQEFVASEQLPAHCLLMIANHDVSPFNGWWQKNDLAIKQQYQLITESQYQQQLTQRIEEQYRLLRFINAEQPQALTLQSDAFAVYSALAQCLARAPSRLFALQIDDLDRQQYPVNIPGTHTEYPNWRRVLKHSCEEIFSENDALLAAINSIRKS
jgi:4-alpha-glucanotransferase